MDEEIERMVVGVRLDTATFRRDVAEMRDALEGPMAVGADRAGRAIETTLLRAIRTGKMGFDDLRTVALQALAEIASATLRSGIASILGGGQGQGLTAVITGLVTGSGAPGRATGGPVSPHRAYWVGERGPELFVPTGAGQVSPTPEGSGRGGAHGGREVRVAITVNASAEAAPGALRMSSRQVARAVKAALAEAD